MAVGKMKAALFFGSGDVRVETVDIPSITENEVLVKVEAALTCGTDLKAFRQGHPVLLGKEFPAPFGHELAGTVAAVGANVKSFEPGMRVVAANSAPCDECYFCRRGKNNLCDGLKLLNGAYAEYIRIPAQIVKHNLYEIPQTLSFKAAALTEPLACAVHAYERLNIQSGDQVVILGCGIMGLLFSAVASHHGAHIIAIGRDEDKLAKARELGVVKTLNVKDESDPVSVVRAATEEGRGADIVVEAVGKPEAWEQAFRMTRKGGTVCMFAGCASGSTFSLDTHRIHYEEVQVMGIFHHTPYYFAKALDYLVQGVIKPEMFVTQELPLEAISAFYADARSTPFKAVVIP